MQHDLQLRAAARAIYDKVYPPADPGPFSIDEAERLAAFLRVRDSYELAVATSARL